MRDAMFGKIHKVMMGFLLGIAFASQDNSNTPFPFILTILMLVMIFVQFEVDARNEQD